MPDLWPQDFGNLEITPPIVVLQEQAAAIGKRTGNRIVGQVTTSNSSDGFRHDLYVIAPYLDGYRFQLLTVIHGVALYPARIGTEMQDAPGVTTCKSYEELVNGVQRVLSSPEARKVVLALLTQTDAITGTLNQQAAAPVSS